ncbi:MAG: hypothetical protein KatS3mg108_0753 [Isosphaeraceae bacterium]|nr:MAG: hypothetical protein KatS3mg108_0753 [Isosphaeraceae bacterium]
MFLTDEIPIINRTRAARTELSDRFLPVGSAVVIHTAQIALGSNLGDRRARLAQALDALEADPNVTVRAISRFYQTQAVGGPDGQGPFLNAAATLVTDLDPRALLERLQAIETASGRYRTIRWAERTLDLDLILFDDRIEADPVLTVPHPRFALRRFVLVPLVEIAPAAVDPLTGRSLADLLNHLDRRPQRVAILPSSPNPDNRTFARLIVDALPEGWQFLADWHPDLPDPHEPTFAIHFGDRAEAVGPPLHIPTLCLDPSHPLPSLQTELRAACLAASLPCDPIEPPFSSPIQPI